jgi:hypothetical protein
MVMNNLLFYDKNPDAKKQGFIGGYQVVRHVMALFLFHSVGYYVRK